VNWSELYLGRCIHRQKATLVVTTLVVIVNLND